MKKIPFLTYLYRGMTSVYWQLAFVTHTNPIIQGPKINVIKFRCPEDNWFADPFILDVNEQTIKVLAEEYIVNKKKGIISYLLINRKDFSVIEKKTVLELESHLSFPFYFREKGNVFIFPENSASGRLTAYKLNDDFTLTKESVVCEAPLTDVAIIKIKGVYYLFSTKLPDENSNKLIVYRSTTLLGEYHFHQEILLNKASARGASGIYDINENHSTYIRYAQDNVTLYGRGLVAQEISFNPETDLFKVKELYRRYPQFEDADIIAMHTYNYIGDIAVIDVKKYQHPFLGKLVNGIRYRIL